MKFEYRGKSVDTDNYCIDIRIPASLSKEISISASNSGIHEKSHCMFDGKPYYICGFDATEMYESVGIPESEQEIILTLCSLHPSKEVD
jgi:hypothetical protein